MSDRLTKILHEQNVYKDPIERGLRARIGELKVALIKAKVAMDWLGDRMNGVDMVDEQDTAITDPLFAEVDKVLKVIDPDGKMVKQEEEIAEKRGKEALEGAEEDETSGRYEYGRDRRASGSFSGRHESADHADG